ncbi:1446_t:CDS:1, partial [Racocetra persica]
MTRNSSSNYSKKNPNDEQPIPRNNNRTKNTSSCNYCRLNKVKCDYLSNGRCRRCINHNRKCESDPQKKRGPKNKKPPGSSIQSREKNLQNLGDAFLRSINGSGQDLDVLILETRSNWNMNPVTTNNGGILSMESSTENFQMNNEQNINFAENTPTLPNSIQESLQNITLNENSSIFDNNESMLSPEINNEQMLTWSPRTPSPLPNSTQESWQNRTLDENSSIINNNESMLSPAINNDQILTWSPRTPSPTRDNQQINNELVVDWLGNVSNTNALSSSSISYMYPGNQQQNLPVLQFPEITPQNFADLRTVSPMEIIGLNSEVDFSQSFCSTPNNTFNQSPVLTGDLRLMSMPMLGDLSPLIPQDPQEMSVSLFGDASPLITASLQPMSGGASPLITARLQPMSGDASPLITASHQPMSCDASPLIGLIQATVIPSLEVSPLINFSTDPQATSMPQLDLGLSFLDLNDETSINFTTNSQPDQHLLS